MAAVQLNAEKEMQIKNRKYFHKHNYQHCNYCFGIIKEAVDTLFCKVYSFKFFLLFENASISFMKIMIVITIILI